MQVTWHEVTTVSFPDLLVRPGEVVAATRFQLAPRSSGRLTDLPVRPGDRVAAGAQIATLAAPELGQALQQAQAELRATRTDLADADADLARLAALAKTQAVSDDALREGQVRRDRASATVAAAEATVAARRESVSELAVRAPEALMVLRRLREPGDLAGPSQPIVEAESADGRRVEVWVPLVEAERLRPGMAVELTLDGQTPPVMAEITRILGSADAATRTCKIEIAIPSTAGAMAGAFGEVRIRLGETPRTAIPEEALIERAGVTGAFVLAARDGGHAGGAEASPGLAARDEVRFRSIQTGRRFDRTVEVLAGLLPGDRVVLAPPPALRDGARVETTMP
jgi:RND family efflux transporter MFP subunit